MACRLSGSRQLSEPIVVYHQVDPWGHHSVKFWLEFYFIIEQNTFENMVPTGSDESKLWTFQEPSQEQISGYKDFYGEFHNADI